MLSSLGWCRITEHQCYFPGLSLLSLSPCPFFCCFCCHRLFDPSTSTSIVLCLYPSVYLSVCLSIYQPIYYESIYASIYICIYQCFSLFWGGGRFYLSSPLSLFRSLSLPFFALLVCKLLSFFALRLLVTSCLFGSNFFVLFCKRRTKRRINKSCRLGVKNWVGQSWEEMQQPWNLK